MAASSRIFALASASLSASIFDSTFGGAGGGASFTWESQRKSILVLVQVLVLLSDLVLVLVLSGPVLQGHDNPYLGLITPPVIKVSL